MSRFLLIILSFALLLSACQPQPRWVDIKSEDWSQDALFYQIFVRSFADSDGDGIGDFKGINQKLDYLNDGKAETDSDLGVNAIWLMPIHPSPSYHGYDVTDYRAVNPDYGTMQDFQAMLEAAHARGMRVIIDFVINHTSSQHPWFQAAAQGDPKYRDYYIWVDENPGFKGPWGQNVWHAQGDAYYYGVFVSEMPDLNYANPAVTAEIEDIAAYWLNEIGVDGFRVDGAKHLIEEGQAQENTPATHAWFKDFAAYHQGIKPEALVVGEIWSPTDQAAAYVNNGELDLVFNFTLADDILAAVTFRDARRLSNSLLAQARAFTAGQPAVFLSNHDQMRAMTKLGGEVTRAKAAATILLTAPGVPFLYYGEEIGMTGDKPDPNIRTPMQWSGAGGEANAGFTTGVPWKPINADYAQKNVEAQSKDPASLLSHYRALSRIRQEHYALRTGAFTQVQASDNRLFAMLRTAEQESILVLVNLSGDALPAPTLEWESSPLTGTLRPVLLLGEGKPAPLSLGEGGGVTAYQPLPEIPAHASVIIQYRR